MMSLATVSLRRSAGIRSQISKTTGLVSRSRILHVNWQQFRLHSTAESLPKIAQPSVWTSIVPKFLRDRAFRDSNNVKVPSKEWNPASFFIVIFIFIGSQAIQLLVLRKDFENYSRRADAKLSLLREVIQKLKNGEQVDVEKLLGTGDESKEREWEEVLREIEKEDSLWRQRSAKQSTTSIDVDKSRSTENNSNRTQAECGTSPHHENAKENRGRLSKFY